MSRNYSGVPHKWAHRATNRAGKVAGRAGNVFYEGEKIYSYGKHFCIARLLPSNVVVFGRHTYSPSTGSHQAAVRGAASHLRTVYCHDPDNSAYRNKAIVENDIKQALEDPPVLAKFKELKKLGGKIRARSLAAEFNEYLAALPEDEQCVEPFDLAQFEHTPQEAARYAVLVREEQARQEVRNERGAERLRGRRERYLAAQEVAAEKLKTRIPDWRNHDYQGSMYDLPTMLRLSKDGVNVETSKGADIPVTHAKRLWPLIQDVRAKGVPLHNREFRLGHYTLTHIRHDGGIVVGCHDIAYEEIEGIAKQLGLLEKEEA